MAQVHKVTLNWKLPDVVGNLKNILVKRALVQAVVPGKSAASVGELAILVTLPPDATTYVDQSDELKEGQSYTYDVSTVNDFGESKPVEGTATIPFLSDELPQPLQGLDISAI